MITFDEILLSAEKYLKDVDVARLSKAFDYAKKIHKDNYRLSGQPHTDHLLAVIKILLPFKPDENTLIAGLMHDLFDGTGYDLSDLEKKFGHEVAAMVENLEKLDRVSLRYATADEESLRQMFLSMAVDLRVVLIRLADRLHNMQTLDFVSPQKRKRIAKETMDIYVPIAARLGIYKLKWKLEDFSFKYLHPQEYEDLQNQMGEYLKQQVEVIDHIKADLQSFLSANEIQARIEGRLKNIFSIYKKLKVKNQTSLQDIFDVFAIRIILPNRFDNNGIELTDHLYSLLALIHGQWSPLINRFKDYVVSPKVNGYRSLHTTVDGLTPKPLKQPTEIQIRSEKMHEESNLGFVSHWLYKEKRNFLEQFVVKENIFIDQKNSSKNNPMVSSFEAYSRLHRDLEKEGEDKFVKPVKVDVFEDRIFAVTPGGDVKNLPVGATPVDFAYAIHTDVGHRCKGVKVNNVIAPLDYKLKNGDVVDILVKNKFDPKLHWLSFVKTSAAKSKIKAYFRNLDIERSFRDGKEILNKYLHQSGKPLLDDHLTFLKFYYDKKLSFRERKSLIAEVGSNALTPGVVLKGAFGIDHHSLNQAALPPRFQENPVNAESKVLIAGETNIPYKLSLCCKPQFGQKIIAYISRGKSVRIHLEKCKHLKNIDSRRTLNASWVTSYYKTNLKRQKTFSKVH